MVMDLKAAPNDGNAYSRIGGAFDNLSDAYPYISKFVSTVDSGRDPLTNSGKLDKVLNVASKAQKIYSYSRKAWDLLDEKTRDSAFIKIGLKVSMDVAGKLLGTSLTTHPYYAYHKQMVEVLADAVQANRNAREAIAQYRTAVKAANSEAVKDAIYALGSRKAAISGSRMDFAPMASQAADIARGLMTAEFARRKIAQYGSAALAKSLLDLELWRAAWAGLAFDALQLQIMTTNELNVAKAAMAKMKDLIASLVGGNNIHKVNGYGAINNIEWEKYDQMVNQGKPAGSVMDPVKFAEGNVARATELAQGISEMCDFARTTDALLMNQYNKQLDKLNKVMNH